MRPTSAAPARRLLRVALLAVAGLTAATTVTVTAASANAANAAAYTVPPANAKADYQLGGAYAPPSGVTVVSRDRTAKPAPGLYNICYVNGFQTQKVETAWWIENHDNLLLKDEGGNHVEDPEWDGELILDISTEENRTDIAEIVNGWVTGCANAGYDAVEIDNLDTFTRFADYIGESDAVAYAQLLTQHAHEQGLAIAQKNSPELAGRRASLGFDFAVAEECARYEECGEYVKGYGDNIIDIEYRDQDFDAACSEYGDTLSVIRRDKDLKTPSSTSYVYDAC